MSNITWLFILIFVALTFPIAINSVGAFLNQGLDEGNEELNIPSSNLGIVNYINDFFRNLNSLPNEVRIPIIAIYTILLSYIVIKLLPFT